MLLTKQLISICNADRSSTKTGCNSGSAKWKMQKRLQNLSNLHKETNKKKRKKYLLKVNKVKSKHRHLSQILKKIHKNKLKSNK